MMSKDNYIWQKSLTEVVKKGKKGSESFLL